jgi:hypothetical protein
MPPTLQSHWEMLIGRWEGPLAFRLLLQPVFAGAFAVRAGLRDARAGRPAYGWQVIRNAGRRIELIREGWQDVGKLFIAAVGVDIVYEIIVFGRIFPAQSIIVACVLAIPTYLVVRGPTNRVAQKICHFGHSSAGKN